MILAPSTPTVGTSPFRLATERRKNPQHRSIPSASEFGGEEKWARRTVALSVSHSMSAVRISPVRNDRLRSGLDLDSWLTSRWLRWGHSSLLQRRPSVGGTGGMEGGVQGSTAASENCV